MQIKNILFYVINQNQYLPNVKKEIATIEISNVYEATDGLEFRDCRITEHLVGELDKYVQNGKELFMKIDGEAANTVIIKRKWQEAWSDYNINVKIVK